MRKLSSNLWALFIFFFLAGCGEQLISQPQIEETAPPPTSTAEAVEAVSVPQSPVALTVLYTSDEHGWMEGQETGQGAANMLGLWREKEGYPDKTRFLVLSGGDSWTGPAISTWYQGESMAQVMKIMGYQASAVGNHEFDFGVESLKRQIAGSSFPYLAANLVYKESGNLADDLGIKPYTIVDLDGILVGVIGLSNSATAYTANPAIVGAFDFADYAETLRTTSAELNQKGAQVVVLTSHLCERDLNELVATAQSMNIAVMGGGHCHMGFSKTINGVAIIDSAPYLNSYAYVDLMYDPATMKTSVVDEGLQTNQGGKADPELQALVSEWAAKTEKEGGVQIGYLKKELPRQSEAMQALIVEAWLWGYPQADVALTNLGGMRDRLAAGKVTLAGVTSVMPFNNTIVEVHLTGTQLQKILEGKLTTPPALGGIRFSDGQWVLAKSGKPLNANDVYSVLVNDFMYAGGDRYTDLAKYDPDAYFTSIDWRQPVIDWIKAQESNENQPLDDAIRLLLEDSH